MEFRSNNKQEKISFLNHNKQWQTRSENTDLTVFFRRTSESWQDSQWGSYSISGPCKPCDLLKR